MKKLLMAAVVCMLSLSANAQFEQGKIYVGSSLTGLNLSYTGKNHTDLGIQAQGGYMIADNVLLLGMTQFQHYGTDTMADEFMAGIGGRYYIVQNGIYLGLNAKLVHAYHNYNDLRPGMEIGYAFFLNRHITIEPAIYYDQSFKKHSDYSTVGLKLGIGVYLFNEK